MVFLFLPTLFTYVIIVSVAFTKQRKLGGENFMLQYIIELVLLPLLVNVVAELIAEWLIRKWQNKGDK